MAPPLVLRSPREVTLSRLASIMGHSSAQPVADLLMMLAEIDPTKIIQYMDRPGVCSDCLFPSLDLFATTSSSSSNNNQDASDCSAQHTTNPTAINTQQQRQQPEDKEETKLEDKSNDEIANKGAGDEDEKSDASSGVKIAVDMQKKTCPDDKGKDDIVSSTENTAQIKQEVKQQARQEEKISNDTVGAGNDQCKKSAETDQEDPAAEDLQNLAASNLSQPVVLSRDHMHEAPAMMLRSLGLSFSSLIDSRVRAWVFGMLRKSLSSNESDGRQALLSLLSVSDAINLSKATTSFQALPSVFVPSKKSETKSEGDADAAGEDAADEKEEHLLLPLIFQAVMDIDMDGEHMSVLIQSPGSILGTFKGNSDLLAKIEVDIDSASLLASMIAQASNVALKMVAFAASKALEKPHVEAETHSVGLTRVEYSGAALAQVPALAQMTPSALKRSDHLKPSLESSSRLKSHSSRLGLTRSHDSRVRFSDISPSVSTLSKTNSLLITSSLDTSGLMNKKLDAIGKKRSAVSWNADGLTRSASGGGVDVDNGDEKKRTRNSEWGSMGILRREVESCSSMKRTISSGASTISRSLKSTKNATFADFGRSGLQKSLSRSSSFALKRPSQNASFTDLRRPTQKPGSSTGNASFNSPPSDSSASRGRRLLMMVGDKK